MYPIRPEVIKFMQVPKKKGDIQFSNICEQFQLTHFDKLDLLNATFRVPAWK